MCSSIMGPHIVAPVLGRTHQTSPCCHVKALSIFAIRQLSLCALGCKSTQQFLLTLLWTKYDLLWVSICS